MMRLKKGKVCIINTGGTISMQRSSKGYVPVAGLIEYLLHQLPEFQHPDMPDYDIHEALPLLDSANMTPTDWGRIGELIQARYDQYDGFLILHGTDTLAYTASALSFMLENLAKPVILTGSQIPLVEARNDARGNLANGLLLAGTYEIPEVCIYFHDVLLRGNRSVKVNADHFAAFDSPRFPPLAKMGIAVEIAESVVRPAPKKQKLRLRMMQDLPVATFRLFPGVCTKILAHLLKDPLRGLILETYGAGNVPTQDQHLLSTLRKAAESGVVIVNVTQCHRGRVNMSHYATGSSLQGFVFSGFDMTIEAAVAKLGYLLSQGLSPHTFKTQWARNLRGEMSQTSQWPLA